MAIDTFSKDRWRTRLSVKHRQILSPREFQVFCHLASGLPATHVATHLSVNVKTVSTYRSRVLEKMNLNSNADMTRYALRVGLID